MTIKLLLLEEVAEMTRLSPATIRWLRHSGTGPAMFRLGRRIVAKEADVLAWIEQQAAADKSGTGTA